VEVISADKMLEKFHDRLENRAKLAGLKIEIIENTGPVAASANELMRGQALEKSWKAATSELLDDAPTNPKRAISAWDALVNVDVSAVERILFNLVDNA